MRDVSLQGLITALHDEYLCGAYYVYVLIGSQRG
jgi:hypothetical protein